MNILHGPSWVRDVTKAEMFDGIFALAGSCNGMSRICVVIVMRQIHCWNKPCSARIHLTVHGVVRDVALGSLLLFGVAACCRTTAGVVAQIDSKRDRSQRCQFVEVEVEVEVVTVALRSGMSATDALME